MEKLEENIKKTNLTIGKTLKKLDRELISLEREFNWLMRQHYQEYSVDSDSNKNSDSNKYSENVKLDKKNTCEKITKKLDRIEIDRKDDLKGNGEGKGLGKCKDNEKEIKISIDSKRTKKKKRVIVWNAWVIDTSSESESDMDDRRVNDRFICSSSDSDSD